MAPLKPPDKSVVGAAWRQARRRRTSLSQRAKGEREAFQLRHPARRRWAPVVTGESARSRRRSS
eukprot:459343-Pleurochrysis_carterae.AAC.1